MPLKKSHRAKRHDVYNYNQKSFNVPQTGKFVCHSSDIILKKQKHIISNKIKKGINRHTLDRSVGVLCETIHR